MIINVASLYREFSGSKAPLNRMELFAHMKHWRDRAAHHHSHPHSELTQWKGPRRSAGRIAFEDNRASPNSRSFARRHFIKFQCANA